MALDRKLEGVDASGPCQYLQRSVRGPADYDIAMTNLQKVERFYTGIGRGKGKPATAVLVAPTMKAKMALAWGQIRS